MILNFVPLMDGWLGGSPTALSKDAVMEKALEALSFDAWCAPTIFFELRLTPGSRKEKRFLHVQFNSIWFKMQLNGMTKFVASGSTTRRS